MPELPEVENVRRTLENLVTGKTMKDVIVTYPKLVKRPDDAELFKELLRGKRLNELNEEENFFFCM